MGKLVQNSRRFIQISLTIRNTLHIVLFHISASCRRAHSVHSVFDLRRAPGESFLSLKNFPAINFIVIYFTAAQITVPKGVNISEKLCLTNDSMP